MYGQEVEVLGSRTCGDEIYYLIKLFDNSKVYLPSWMTDETECKHCVVQTSPVCSLKALRALRQFIDNNIA